ncbi:Fusarisetin A cluster transcription factor fsa6 [Colletotrichum orbiculare MAFF 240422]|uniref:Fusarisetin A cluster transcription factor fsa6 n=1 Tax=Colletotrichum orbiculare (strain 104-T / ATCC 96160 / CBS 514.97 / LARS 414 / MAFF 240422) TaxID=1213857 RepID=A0A484FUK1_COLOR|nr:Fusarisetin A cluster transcription factor fsa6 [Colletotrichum orbiculare MAFF 240422]
MAPMMQSPVTPLRYRKNGRLQACDPCRRRKVACDHARPRHVTPTRGEEPPRSASSVVVVSEPDDDPPIGPTAVEVQRSAGASDGAATREQRHAHAAGGAVDGHLGFTSFEDVYREVGDGLSESHQSSSAIRASDATVPQLPMSPSTAETCLFILKSVPEESAGRTLFASYFDPHDGFVHPVARRALDLLYGTFGSYLGAERSDQELKAMARIMCANTARPFSEHEADAEVWMAQFTGPNLRWEMLGILFIYWELSSRDGNVAVPESLKTPGTRKAALELRDAFRKCLNDCTALARGLTEVGNTLLLYVYWKRTIIASMVLGDTSLSCWMYNGEAISLMTFLGLHAEPQKGPYKPTLASEIRRRVLYKIFVIDKVVSSITGRPPMLSRRYMLTPPPLDLKDDYLLADEETLARGVAALDDKGYNTDGAIHSITFWRARSQLMIIRDEIFETSLGNAANTSLETLYDLKRRAGDAAAALPDALALKDSDVRHSDIGPAKLYVRLLMRLEHLQNLFFIERLLNRKGCSNGKDLLCVSYEMTSTTLLFWTKMDGLAVTYEDFKWLIMAYAAPGGGIMCLELLQPSVTLGGTVASSNGDQITRSSIVQLLSMLVGFLNWVGPKEANGNICTNCRAIVQRVLDQALNVVPHADGPPADVMEWDFSAHLDFNFDLLDTFEWMRPEFSWTDASN